MMNIASRKSKRMIAPQDVMAGAEYAKNRAELRKSIVALKRRRRMDVGPIATFYFECYETMLQQVQEMLHIEKGGPDQLVDELAAYNPLIPQGDELIATVMFEIEDPIRRQNVLSRLGGIEHAMFIQLGEKKIIGRAEEDQDRTNAEGKASSVQFVHFEFSADDIALFRSGKVPVIVGMNHPNYAHMAVMPEDVRQELAGDFD